jgi:FkbM family methyltransferase
MADFISYAQNFEDVLLWRALKTVGQGFYVDVGAHDPVIDSVTKAFYERGWRGINIEPVPHWHERMAGDRPADLNLQIAVSSSAGSLELYEVVGTGLSTVMETVAQHHQDDGFEIRKHAVAAKRLDDIFRENKITEIHFLKIDVEGNEAEVLKGMDFSRVRPWIVVIESTEPRGQATTHHVWEQLVTANKYKFAWFDGLNRFYVADEHLDLLPVLAAPPNVFDDFIQYELWQTRADLQNMQAYAKKLETDVAEAHARLRAIFASWSWRLTKPLRVYHNLRNRRSR